MTLYDLLTLVTYNQILNICLTNDNDQTLLGCGMHFTTNSQATKRRPPYVFTKVCVAPIAVTLTTTMANIIVITGHSLRTMNKIIIRV